MDRFLPKHFIGVVERGISSDVSKRSPEVSSMLLKAGKGNPDEALALLNTSHGGLFKEEVEARIEKYGRNEIAHEKPPAWWVQFFKAFLNPFIGILLVLAGTSFFTDIWLAKPEDEDWIKVALLLIMISVSVTLRFWQEYRSQKSAQKLRALVQNKARVSRRSWENDLYSLNSNLATFEGEDKLTREIVVGDIVPGDIVHLSAGDMVPADMRLISSTDLFVSQSALTGESMPIEKFAVPINAYEESEFEKDELSKNPLDLNTLCFMGTNVVSGFATGVVVATGDRTNFGSMAESIVGERALTSFDIGINKVSWTLIRFMLVMVPVVFVLNGVTKGDWGEAFFFALAVAVGLTPEMLPLVVTANLAKGAMSMAKQKVIVKKLNAIQNLGAMDILCTDKTGTLTENRVVLMRHLDPSGDESEHVLSLAYLNSYFQTGLKNIMDQAVIDKREDGNEDLHTLEERSYHKIDEIPFDFDRRRMSVVVEKNKSEHVLICKGAVEEVLNLCSKVEYGGEVRDIDEGVRTKMRELTVKLNEEGLRVLAIGYKTVPDAKKIYAIEDESDLILVGYIGFLDPPKVSAREALDFLEEHGVSVKIITGDNDIVTTRICTEVGLNPGKVLLGSDMEGMGKEDLQKIVEGTTIFAKIDPLQKARIVEALRQNGHTVGYMGDGVNDAAAMREADVGISVDTGVDIAKEAADIILLENDLHVLGRGVSEGRTIFGNIMKYIKMASSSNFGNVLSILVASVFLPFLPMLPIHMFLQNLLYDLSQLSIPWDNMDKEFLRKPRKWEAHGITRFMLFMGPISSIFDIITFATMWFVFGASTVGMQAVFQSGWFIEGLLSQTLIVHMIRSHKIPFLQSVAAKPVILLTSFIMSLGILIPFTEFGSSIGLTSLPAKYFLILVLILLGYAVVTHLVKRWYIKRFAVWL